MVLIDIWATASIVFLISQRLVLHPKTDYFFLSQGQLGNESARPERFFIELLSNFNTLVYISIRSCSESIYIFCVFFDVICPGASEFHIND